MAATAQPKIAHGIARLHPDCGISSQYEWGPEWSLPPNRSGRWVIDRIYNTAIRAEFDDSLPREGAIGSRIVLDAAREALSVEDEKRRNEWLGWADKREAEAFVRQWNARKRREYDMPTVAAGTYVRRSEYSSGVWHIATGKLTDHWRDPNRLDVGTECPMSDITIDLGDPQGRTFAQTTEPDRVCKRCSPRVEPAEAAPERQEALVTA